MSERELELALKVIELTELRDKLLYQNESYRDLAQKERENCDNLVNAESFNLFEKIVRKHKTVINILHTLSLSEIGHGHAEALLKKAILENKQFTEQQVLQEARKL